MPTLAPKRPTEVRQYVFNFSQEIPGDPIQAFQLAVTSGGVVVNSTSQPDGYTVSALIAGGGNGQTSTLELQVTTESGQLIIRDYSLYTANVLNATGSYPSSTTKGQIMQMVLAQVGMAGVGYVLASAATSTATKGQIVNMAFEEISLAGYEFDASAAEQASALQRLDSLMAQMSGPGVNLNIGYNFPAAIGGSGLGDKSGVPDILLDATVCMLAVSLAGVIGKTLGAEVQARIKSGVTTTRIAYAVDLRELDALMAQWASPGFSLDIGYNFPTSIGGSLSTDLSGIPDLAVDAVVLELAHVLPIPDKVITPQMSARHARAMTALRATFARIPHMHLPRLTPRGAGAKPRSTWWPFIGSFGSSNGSSGQPNAPQPAVLETESGQIITTENGAILGV